MSDESVSVNLTLRSGEGDISIRQIALGANPLVLIEPEMDDEGDVLFSVDATAIEQEELADVLELVVLALREGVEDS